MSVHTKEPKKEPRPHTKLAEARHKEQRRGHRMNSRVPVRLEWDLPSGKRVKAEAHTRVVNPYGCMVVLQHDLPLEHRVAITNVPGRPRNVAVMVGKGDGPREGGWKSGVGLGAPARVFGVLELCLLAP